MIPNKDYKWIILFQIYFFRVEQWIEHQGIHCGMGCPTELTVWESVELISLKASFPTYIQWAGCRIMLPVFKLWL